MATITVSLRDFPVTGTVRIPKDVAMRVEPFWPVKAGTALVTADPTIVPLSGGDGSLVTDPGYYWVSFIGVQTFDLLRRRLVYVTGDAALVDLWLAPIDPNTLAPSKDAARAGWDAALADAVRRSQNLADIPDKAAARANLDVLSTADVSATIADEIADPVAMLAAASVSLADVMPSRVPRVSDLSASLTPDGRTKYTFLSGQPDQVYTTFAGGWNATDGQAVDAVHVKRGTASRKLITPAAGTYSCRFSNAATFPPASLVCAWVWVEEPAKVTSLGFVVAAGWSRSATGLSYGWNLLRFRASDGTLTSWGTNTITQVTLVTSAATSLSIGEVWAECPPKAQLCLIEDRGYKSFATIGLPDLRALSVPVTWALDPALNGTAVGTPGEVVTDADVDAFYAAGDDISIHAWDGAIMSTMTAAMVREDSLRALDWLQTRGYSRGRQWRASWTQNNAPQHAAAQPYFAAYASAVNLSGSVETWPLIDRFNVGRYALQGRAPSEIDNIFNILRITHQTLFAYTHGIDDALSGAITNAQWDYFVGKVATAMSEGWLEAVTFSQLLARSGGIVR